MANQWFRMYSEFATDAKVQMMSEVMQRRYLMLMCLRCSNTLVTLQDEEIAFQLRIGNEELAETKALFIKKGFIDSGWNLLNWEKRQFASDSSAARVAKHRALQKEKQKSDGNDDVTLQKQQANALDTEQNRTDTEEPSGSVGKSADLPGFVQFWQTWPTSDRKQARGKCHDAWKKARCESVAAEILAHVEALKASASWRKNSGEFIPAPLVYLNNRRWEGAELDAAAQPESAVGAFV
jgi:hypothetical protein